MSLANPVVAKSEWRWLHAPVFDTAFIAGFLLVGILSIVAIMHQPSLYYPILLADLWLLGYHHHCSTYTRMFFDRESFARSQFLIFGLLPMVAAGVAALAYFVGIWAVFSLYFYWQWFHYARQSWGVARSYRSRDTHAAYEDGWLDQAIFWSLPVVGLVFRSWQGHTKFLGQDIVIFTIPGWALAVATGAMTVLMGIWIVNRMEAWRQGRLAKAHTAYMISHFAVFAIAYIIIPDLTLGWLVVNIWHNGQYIMFVWMFNTRRFRDGVDPRARFLSFISQPRNLWLYLGFSMAFTAVMFLGVYDTIDKWLAMGMTGTILVYQIANFYHYILDSVIWKTRKGPLKEVLDR